MKKLLLSFAFLLVNTVYAWDSLVEMENEICCAMTNNAHLLSESFTNKLSAALSSSSVEMRGEAYVVLSINAYQNYLNTMEEHWLQTEFINASNAVETLVQNFDKWQYWVAKFVYAGSYASVSDFSNTFSEASASLVAIGASNYTNSSSSVESAILGKFEMHGLDVEDALKVMSAMSAAELGMGNVATNYANQLPATYRNMIFDFMR